MQPRLRPKYAALTQNRLYLVESQRAVYLDVSVVRTRTSDWTADADVSTIPETDVSVVFKIEDEEIREPFLEIVDASGGHVVTAIEVISPANKDRSRGQRAYLQKRDEFWEARTNIVEIDLLRGNPSVTKVPQHKLDSLQPFDYVVAVTRSRPGQHEVYAFRLENRLPRIAIPLLDSDPDITLDLQLPFNRCWDEGPYPALSRYDETPPGELSVERIEWCQQRLRAAKFIP